MRTNVFSFQTGGTECVQCLAQALLGAPRRAVIGVDFGDGGRLGGHLFLHVLPFLSDAERISAASCRTVVLEHGTVSKMILNCRYSFLHGKVVGS